jgi:adenylate cyclase
VSAAALGILLTGPRQFGVTAMFAALGVVLAIAVHFVAPVNTGLMPPEVQFYGFLIPNIIVNSALLFFVVFYAFRNMTLAEAAAEREHRRSESLLTNILPPPVANRLKDAPDAIIADAYPEASVLFMDMAGFTARTSDTAPSDLVRFLNGVFTKLDGLVERHGLEKIKTSGDAYMVVSGVPDPRADHATALADLALDMRDAMAGLLDPKDRPVPVRIGLASGPVVAGVIGTRKFFYDVWGDTVNMASRMESTGVPGEIQMTQSTFDLINDAFVCTPRGTIAVKGKGDMPTWFLNARKPPVR